MQSDLGKVGVVREQEVYVKTTNVTEPTGKQVTAWLVSKTLKLDWLVRAVLVVVFAFYALNLLSVAWNGFAYFSGIILNFFAGWMVFLMLSQLVGFMTLQGLPKWLAILIAYLLMISAIALLTVMLLPSLIQQSQQLTNNLNSIFTDLTNWATNTLAGVGLNNALDIKQLGELAKGFGGDILKTGLNIATGVPMMMINLILVIVISATLLASKDYNSPKAKTPVKQKDSLLDYLPFGTQEWLKLIGESFERNFGGFLGGQVAVGVVFGIITIFTMSVTGYSYAVPTGVFCGLLLIIPFFGGFLSLIPLTIAGLGSTGAWIPLWLLILILLGIQAVLVNYLLPKLIGESSGIGPLTTLFVLLAGSQVGGLWGILLGVPMVGASMAVLKRVFQKSQEKMISESQEIKTPPKSNPAI